MAAFSYFESAHALTVKTWENRVSQEYRDNLFWMKYSGMDDGAIIQTKENLTKTKGDKITVGIRSNVIGGRVDGASQGIGNEGTMEYYDFGVTVDITRQLVKKEHVKISNQRVAFELLDDVRPAIVDQVARNLESDITTSLTDTSTGRVRGRYLYGSSDANWNATHATALTAVDNTNDKMGTSMVEDAKMKAQIPTLAHAKLRPMQVRTGERMGVQEWYVLVMHLYNGRDMVRHDAAWKNAQLNIPPGTNMSSPIFTGNTFLGAWRSVLLYEWEGIPLVSSTIVVSHNLFLGAQAGVCAWAKHSTLGHEEFDLGHTQVYESWEIRNLTGMKVVYDRAAVNGGITNEDNGIVHVFAAAVA